MYPAPPRAITIYIAGRKQLWLHLKDVPWAIKYMFIQQLLKGIDVVASDDEGPDHDEKPAAAEDSQCSTHDSTLSVAEDSQCSTSSLSVAKDIPAHCHVSREWDEAP